MKDINKNKKILVAVAVLVIVLAIVGSTYAYLSWQTSDEQKTNVVFTYNDRFSCAVDGGGDMTEEDVEIIPTTCMSDHAIKREVTVTPSIFQDDITIDMDLWINVDKLDSGLSGTNEFKYALTTSSTSCTDGVIASGTFNGKSAEDTIKILDRTYNSSFAETYYLYIWLQDVPEMDSSTMNQTFNLSLGGVCSEMDAVSPEAPVLNDGMIPVTISSNGIVTTVAEDDESWYDYDNKEWANVVLVDSDSRDTYSEAGVTVTQSDILAYYVWIPRYKYKIWTTGTSSAGEEQEIDIVFETSLEPMTNGTSVGEYITHPAFWWDDDNDGIVDYWEKLSGIWVGKFETSTDTSSTCYTSVTNCNNANQSPRILPNVSSLRYQSVSNQFLTSQLFTSSDNIYGLTKIVDSHMMKNSEWGAVAYLSHSIYGINSEIYINNSSSCYTGRSGGNVGGSANTIADQYSGQTSTNKYISAGYYTWTGQEIAYDGTIGDYAADRTLGTNASTTGNVTGVYDMSGGAYEYVMGVLADSDGNPRSGYSSSNNSGFNGLLSDDTSYTSGITFPALKYYDLYTGTTSDDSCNGGKCYGHALSETYGWYGDYAYFVYSDYPWFARGGGYSGGSGAGAFLSDSNHGNTHPNGSWRSVLVPINRNWGDINLDGIVDNVDATLVLQYDAELITLSGEALINCDVNIDGYCDADDSYWILSYSVGEITSLPVTSE